MEFASPVPLGPVPIGREVAMKAILRALIRGDEAQDLVESALLCALLSVVSILALQTLGVAIRNGFFGVIRYLR
jgi:Flp pilus assembly pilin Flp